ncbi:MAG: tetratricopeptide repeat protein [Thermosynechococcaceae cyanobacterium]
MLNRTTSLGLCFVIALVSGAVQNQTAFAQEMSQRSTSAVDATIKQARRAFKEGRYAEAEVLWRNVLKDQPNSAEAFYQLGFSLHLQEEIGSAIAAYRKAIALKPDYDAPHMNLGLALIELQQLDEAAKSFEQVLTLPDQPETPASTHALAHYNLAIIQKRQEQPEQALQNVDAALKITPDFSQAQELRLQLLNPQRQEE